jgi:hypothetical protein
MSQATVKYISNGYTVVSLGNAVVPDSLYAATIPEVVYWLGRLLDPLAPAGAEAAPARSCIKMPAPAIIDGADDPLQNQQAQVATIKSGGFVVTQLPNMNGAELLDVYCVDMDAVSAALTAIYTPPAQEPGA